MARTLRYAIVGPPLVQFTTELDGLAPSARVQAPYANSGSTPYDLALARLTVVQTGSNPLGRLFVLPRDDLLNWSTLLTSELVDLTESGLRYGLTPEGFQNDVGIAERFIILPPHSGVVLLQNRSFEAFASSGNSFQLFPVAVAYRGVP